MNGPAAAAIAVALGYLLGAVPIGLLVGRAVGGVDPRTVGSGRTGATNVLRTMGWGGAALVLVLDIGKGLAAVLLARFLFAGTERELVAAAAGVAALVGHVRSVFIGFRGGRGVATGAGALLGMAPLVLLITAPVVIVVIWRTRLVSLGSLTGAVLGAVAAGLLALGGAGSIEAFWYAAVAGLLVVVAHADNIGRLLAGSERRLGEKEAVPRDG